MNRATLPLVLLSTCGFLATVGPAIGQERETYTWVDSAGQRHYSDRPPPEDARQVRTLKVPLPGAASAPSPASPAPARRPSSRDEEQSEPPQPPTMLVVRPQADETFVNTSGLVPVSVNVQPQLPEQSRVTLYLDGAVAASGAPGQLSFQLSPVYRGTHSLSAVLIDRNGTLLTSTPNVTFHVRQQSLISPP